jgi:hypothetical protein
VSRLTDQLRAQDAAAISAASTFVVNWFLGRGQWERSVALPSLAEARAIRDQRGSDEFARRGMIYAVTAAQQTIFVE